MIIASQYQSLMHRWSSALLILGLVVITSIGCTDDTPKGPPAEVLDFTFKRLPGGAKILSGTLHNPGHRYLRNAVIQISLFNNQNERLETLNITITHVEAGDQKSFREPLQSKEAVTRAKVRRILSQYAPS